MKTKPQLVKNHRQKAHQIRCGYRPGSTADRLAELVGAACSFWLIKNPEIRVRRFNEFQAK
jgi:hypothetical protein